MKHYITINERNEITGGYIQNIHKDIPKNAIEVSEAIWKQRLDDSSLNCYEDGKLVKKDFTTDEQREEQRIQQIKSKANELILARYSIIWQLNHPRDDIQYKSDYDFIDNIRRISNEAEANGTALEDINWEIANG